jgi:hypothetical protein
MYIHILPTFMCRAVTGGRTTTFIGLRIVYLDGHNCQASDAIWPLAIIERPEKRGPFRQYTQELRRQLAHVQTQGVLLPSDYVEVCDPPSPPAVPAPPPPAVPASRPVVPAGDPPSQPQHPPVGPAAAPPPGNKYGIPPDEKTDCDEVEKYTKLIEIERQRRKHARERRADRLQRRSRRGVTDSKRRELIASAVANKKRKPPRDPTVIEEMTVNELKAALTSRKLSRQGRKANLRLRLREAVDADLAGAPDPSEDHDDSETQSDEDDVDMDDAGCETTDYEGYDCCNVACPCHADNEEVDLTSAGPSSSSSFSSSSSSSFTSSSSSSFSSSSASRPPPSTSSSSSSFSSSSASSSSSSSSSRPPPPPVTNPRHAGVLLWLAADYKFLLVVLGFKGATCKHPCIFCKACLSDPKEWKVSRALDERKADDKPDPNFSQHCVNLFPFIPRTRCRIDVLHMLLRCMDRFLTLSCLLSCFLAFLLS